MIADGADPFKNGTVQTKLKISCIDDADNNSAVSWITVELELLGLLSPKRRGLSTGNFYMNTLCIHDFEKVPQVVHVAISFIIS